VFEQRCVALQRARGLSVVPLVLFLGVACGDSGGNGGTEPDTPRPASLTVTPESFQFESIGASVQFSASVLDQFGHPIPSATVFWFCSPTHVASVSPTGLVTSQGAGNANLMATAGQARDDAQLSVVLDPPEILTRILPIGVVGSEYERALQATGGDGTYTWSLSAGKLPGGLTMSAAGIISGEPTLAGESTFTVEVSSGGRTASKELSITVSVPPVWISTEVLPSAVIGTTYHQTLAGTGGDGSFTWSIDSGLLPDGLDLNADGTVSGTPTALGDFSFILRVSSGGQEGTKNLSITIVSGDLGVRLDSLQFELIPAGSFEMGSIRAAEERPVHSVTITQPFYMQKTEVTQAQWRFVMGENPSRFSSCGDTCPIEAVNWDDIQEFIARLNQAAPGMNYRLPTEAEWEYAARAGTTGDYGGTGTVDEMAWYVANSFNKTHPVGLKQPNAWGLYDMHGNVFESVQDFFDSEYYSVSPVNDPPGPASGSLRGSRGGDYTYSAFGVRSAFRGYHGPTARSSRRGFRLVKTP